MNADHKIKSWFQVGTNTSIERYERQSLSQASEYAGSTLLGALIIDPLTPTLFHSVDEMPFNMRNAYENGFDVVQLNPWNAETETGLKQNPGWE